MSYITKKCTIVNLNYLLILATIKFTIFTFTLASAADKEFQIRWLSGVSGHHCGRGIRPSVALMQTQDQQENIVVMVYNDKDHKDKLYYRIGSVKNVLDTNSSSYKKIDWKDAIFYGTGTTPTVAVSSYGKILCGYTFFEEESEENNYEKRVLKTNNLRVEKDYFLLCDTFSAQMNENTMEQFHSNFNIVCGRILGNDYDTVITSRTNYNNANTCVYKSEHLGTVYKIGQLGNNGSLFFAKETKGEPQRHSSIAFANTGKVIEISESAPNLHYSIGEVFPDSTAISWGNNGKKIKIEFGEGSNPCVAIYNDIIIMVYERHHGLYYRIASFGSDKNIINVSPEVKYGGGHDPFIAVSSDYIVEVHNGKHNDGKLYYQIGILK